MRPNITTVEGVLSALLPGPEDRLASVIGALRRGDKQAAADIAAADKAAVPARADYLSAALALGNADVIGALKHAGDYCSRHLSDKFALYNMAVIAEAVFLVNKADFAFKLALQGYIAALQLDQGFASAAEAIADLGARNPALFHAHAASVQPPREPLTHLRGALIEVPTVEELMKIFGWTMPPILARDDIYIVEHDTDINERRIRDAEALGVVLRNAAPKVALEIGTCTGAGTAQMSANAPQAQIYTINIPPEEIISGEGGRLTTVALENERIGHIYQEKGCANITQIYANTLHWQPNIGTIDVAFVDGCHDTEFVINDTTRIAPHMRKGGFVLWHDCNLGLTDKFGWIYEVCLGIDRLLAQGIVRGPVYNLRHSWIGIAQIQ